VVGRVGGRVVGRAGVRALVVRLLCVCVLCVCVLCVCLLCAVGLLRRIASSTRPADLVFVPTSACGGSRSDARHYSPSPGSAAIWTAGGAGLTS